MKYSACYVKVNPNFVIDNITKGLKPSDEFNSIFAIAQNIIQRGCPTKPSKYAREKLGEYTKFDKMQYYDNKVKLDWSRTILGGDKVNPALDFYEKSLLKSVGENFVNTFLPECKLNQIINTIDKINDLYVDFYSPALKCVIEIDGKQHNTNLGTLTDSQRDKALKDVGIEVIRIPTKLIGYPIFKLQNIVKRTNCDDCDLTKISENDRNYCALIRYQMLILSLLKSGVLSLESDNIHFEIKQNDFLKADLFNIAYIDLIELITNIANLMNIEIKEKSIDYKIVDEFSDKDCIKVDLDIFSKYFDYPRTDVIYIRNDYFYYNSKANYKVKNSKYNIEEELLNRYVNHKNYYQVCNGQVNYEVDMHKQIHHESLLYFLEYIFGFKSFNHKQEEIIVRCLNKGSVIGLLPTGAGKSLCYQLSSFLLPGITLVVSPLKVLMEDQVANLVNRHQINNICCINSTCKRNIDLFLSNQTKILLISPERFFSEDFLQAFSNHNVNVSLVTIDEVHCLSEWGHDFRTSYLCLTYYFKETLSDQTKLMGLTATASSKVCQDILAEFQTFKKNTILIQADSLNRKNLNVMVNPVKYDQKKEYLMNHLKSQIVNNNINKTLVFTATKSPKSDISCTSLSMDTKKYFPNIIEKIEYFAGVDDNSDSNNIEKLQKFKDNQINLLFATKAFGMGVDIPNIRNTIHYNLPASIESLYQEFGRAGRDGNESNCYIYYYKEDEKLLNDVFNNDGRTRIDFIKSVSKKFKEFGTIIYFIYSSYLDIEKEQVLIECLYKLILEKFKEESNVNVTFSEIKNCLDKEIFDKKIDIEINQVLVEKFLYRLYILKRISIWGIVYSESLKNPIFTNIKVLDGNIENQIEAINSYIKKYQLDYSYNKNKTSQAVLTELLTWIYDNFVYQKIQSIKNYMNYVVIIKIPNK